jgi:hypothetical protein
MITEPGVRSDGLRILVSFTAQECIAYLENSGDAQT